ncbi:MAG: hypothetical protein IKG72_13040 [Bacillus sp. (in: Bacteria)]|nr:hypothetical protein [Parasporobacterium sp.]MBR3381008.1 hypothetical protein [Bacillus sp. (in: firmicutes)]
MKPTTFIRQFEESYKKGTYVPYSYTRTMDLYVPKNRAMDGENEITEVIKVTYGVGRLVNYGAINTVMRDNLIKDLCVGLYEDRNINRQRFTHSYGMHVDLDSYSIRELEEMVKKYSAIDARFNDPLVKAKESSGITRMSRYLTSDIVLGTTYVSVMSPRNRLQSPDTHYIVSEKTPSGETITKQMSHKEFAALGKVAKSPSYSSNRFAKESCFSKLVELGILKDINGPAESVMFKLKLDNVTRFGNAKEEE